LHAGTWRAVVEDEREATFRTAHVDIQDTAVGKFELI
jgi:hypothetical protein